MIAVRSQCAVVIDLRSRLITLGVQSGELEVVVRYGFLGPVEVWDGDRSVKIGGRQQQRLLAVLLSQPGHVIETHRLVDVLWPDGLAPEAADHSVSTYVHRLRLAIGDRAIVTHGSGYTFDPAAGDLDVDEFEDLVAQAAPCRAGCGDRALRRRALGCGAAVRSDRSAMSGGPSRPARASMACACSPRRSAPRA